MKTLHQQTQLDLTMASQIPLRAVPIKCIPPDAKAGKFGQQSHYRRRETSNVL